MTAPSDAPDGPVGGDTATNVPPPAIAALVALALCALFAHRQGERDALRLAGVAVATAVPLPTAFVVVRDREPVRQAPPATPDPAATSPGMGDEELQRLAVATFSEARRDVLDCLREERRSRPGLRGKLPVTVAVDENGLIGRVELGVSTVRSEPFDECVMLSIAQLVFPTTFAGRELSITYALE